MTKRELIEALKDFPDNADVVGIMYDNCDHAYQSDIEEVKLVTVDKYKALISPNNFFVDEHSDQLNVILVNMF